ncbi:MAG: ATP-binding cassette domain-containing protein [Deltaproteobacteria bacterium]
MFGIPLKVRALDGVSFFMNEFETLGVVGESGSGKSTLAKIITRLIPPTSGGVRFDPQAIRDLRRDVQIIFQNPYASLDPRMRIGDAVAEPMVIQKKGDARRRRERVRELLDSVGIDPASAGRFPSQFSGGQRQRVCIARALACEPKFLVLDEPVSSLDLTVQLRLMELLAKLKKDLRLTYVFISHNLAVIQFIADSVLVMKGGRVVEHGPREEIFRTPREAYTRSLIEAGTRA